MITPRALPVILGMALSLVGYAGGDGGRFSESLDAPARASCGLDRLASSQLLLLDDLVSRAETAGREGAFSRGLSSNERRLSGLDELAEVEVARIDALVTQRMEPASPLAAARAPAAAPGPVEVRAPLEIHGGFSAECGFGSGGYSAIGGSAFVEVYDPASNWSLTAAYSQYDSSDNWGRWAVGEGSIGVQYNDPAGRYSLGAGCTRVEVETSGSAWPVHIGAAREAEVRPFRRP